MAFNRKGKLTARTARDSANERNAEERLLAISLGRLSTRQNDLSLIDDILRLQPFEHVRVFLEELRKRFDDPNYSLPSFTHKRLVVMLNKLHTVRRIEASGKEYKPQPKRPRARYVPKNPKPAWMSDPSLLPKKPPGR